MVQPCDAAQPRRVPFHVSEKARGQLLNDVETRILLRRPEGPYYRGYHQWSWSQRKKERFSSFCVDIAQVNKSIKREGPHHTNDQRSYQ